jgi:hypothetical protein
MCFLINMCMSWLLLTLIYAQCNNSGAFTPLYVIIFNETALSAPAACFWEDTWPSIVCVCIRCANLRILQYSHQDVFHLSFCHTVPPLILNLSTRWRWVVSLTFHSHFILRERVPCFHWAGSWVGPGIGMDIWRREKSLVHAKDQAKIPWSNSI